MPFSLEQISKKPHVQRKHLEIVKKLKEEIILQYFSVCLKSNDWSWLIRSLQNYDQMHSFTLINCNLKTHLFVMIKVLYNPVISLQLSYLSCSTYCGEEAWWVWVWPLPCCSFMPSHVPSCTQRPTTSHSSMCVKAIIEFTATLCCFQSSFQTKEWKTYKHRFTIAVN